LVYCRAEELADSIRERRAWSPVRADSPVRSPSPALYSPAPMKAMTTDGQIVYVLPVADSTLTRPLEIEDEGEKFAQEIARLKSKVANIRKEVAKSGKSSCGSFHLS